MSYGYLKQVEISPRELGVNAAPVNVTVTSNWINVTGYDQVTLEVDYTYSAGTALTVYVDSTHDETASSVTARRKISTSISAGTATVSNLIYSRTVGAANQGLELNIPVNNVAVRFVFAMTGAPDASDLVTARVRLGVAR